MVLAVAGEAEADAREGAELRLSVRAELSMTPLPEIVVTDVSGKSGLEKAMDCPTVAPAFPAKAFLSSSTLEESPMPDFPSSVAR